MPPGAAASAVTGTAPSAAAPPAGASRPSDGSSTGRDGVRVIGSAYACAGRAGNAAPARRRRVAGVASG